MKQIYLFGILLMMIMPFGLTSAQTLVFSDEFDYSGLPDSDQWGNEVGYIRNNELQYYTDRDIDNQVVANGSLEIRGLEESLGGYNYTSASINTKGKFDFTYGTIEARMKLPSGQGLWPAFWTLGISIDQTGWPQCGEIDVVEHVNNHSYTTGTAHWASDKGQGRHESNQGYYDPIDVTQWHTYSVVWDESNITWFVDGNQFHQMSILNGVDGTTELHSPQYILLNLAIGGDWPGAPDASTIFPATMYVDYVRVYQNDSSSEPPASENLVLNPGFEDGFSLAPWTSWGNVSVVGNNAYSGSNAVYVDGSGAAEQIVTVEPNTTYTLSGIGKVSKNRQSVFLGVKNHGGAETSVIFDQTSYAQKSLQFTTGSTATTATIYFYVAGSRDAAYGDDFSITPSSLKSAKKTLKTEDASLVGKELQISPNPLSDSNLNLYNLEEDAEILVFTINGKEIYKAFSTGQFTKIERSVFGKPGLYLIQIKTHDDLIMKKVVVR
jgi:beta-glucanase (GH16 family)